jgi:hypothetical protein
MSDRDLTCKICEEGIVWDSFLQKWFHADPQYREWRHFAAPVEPPVLSREFLDSLIEKIWNSDARPLGNLPWAHKDVYDDAFTLLRDAILESLSQESSE